ncbi:MAG: hypothetical protein Hens2KO_29540 [Henriciella sp.]
MTATLPVKSVMKILPNFVFCMGREGDAHVKAVRRVNRDENWFLTKSGRIPCYGLTLNPNTEGHLP